MWTEFVSSEGLLQKKSYEKIKPMLIYSETERPIVAQIFGKDPTKMRDSAYILKDLGFDGVDINMGCPDQNQCSHGNCAALINDFKLAQQIILEVKSAGIPVSVKTRIEDWTRCLLDVEPEAITLHLRTKYEMSKVPAHWTYDVIGKAVEVKKEKQSNTLIIGNGDVENLQNAKELALTYGIDGVMIGRGIFGKPWLFREPTDAWPTLSEKIDIMIEHTQNHVQNSEYLHSFIDMRKHFKAYLQDEKDLKIYSQRLMAVKTAPEALTILFELKNHVT